MESILTFIYEKKKDSAVIWRCFSRDPKVELPKTVAGLPVRELAPYAFSAHMDEKELRLGLEQGRLSVYEPGLFGADVTGKTYTEEDVRRPGGGHTDDDSRSRWELPQLPAMCGDLLGEIVLPGSMQRVGRYCFYNCAKLHRVAFGGLTDWGSGVFTGCHHVNRICVRAGDDGRSSLKQVLDEIWEALEVEYTGSDGRQAQLVFPECYEEGVENTPARILETHVHGSGMLYRNCFQNKSFDFAQYDAVFPYACAQEPAGLVARMVMGRLRFPVSLSEKAREQYEAYAVTHGQELACCVLDARDMDGLRWLVELAKRRASAELLPYLAEQASHRNFPEAISYLMECMRPEAKHTRRRWEL